MFVDKHRAEGVVAVRLRPARDLEGTAKKMLVSFDGWFSIRHACYLLIPPNFNWMITRGMP